MTQHSPVHPVYARMPTTVFEHMSGLARDLGAINLGQGFPDGNGPPEVLAAAARAMVERSSQYPPSLGLPDLRDALCRFYRRRQGLELTRDNVIVTSGATEAIACAVLALVNPGDEVILFQPAYDAYAPMVRRAGGVPVSLRLDPPHWRYDAGALASAITQKTRVLMLNDPLNPAGTVASEAELMEIAALCVTHDLTAICDEVWEEVRFDAVRHRSLIDFSGMAQRTVKIGSAGKIFGVTGWKVGWMIAGGELAAGLARAHQFVTFTTPPALQWAVAEALDWDDAWFDAQRAVWGRSRARLVEGLGEAGYAVLPNAATWFVCMDLANSGVTLDDAAFSERAVRDFGVASIPVSALFGMGDPPRHVLRLCYAKPDAMLDEAVDRLAMLRRSIIAG